MSEISFYHVAVFLMFVQEERASIRLFDRGDLNAYEDELRFLIILATCCRGASISDTLDMKDLERLQSSFLALLSDVTRLISTIRSESIDSMFRPSTQAQLRDSLIALTRRYVAACWLRHVLIGNNVTVDNLQHIHADMLDISRQWLWLSDFVRIL